MSDDEEVRADIGGWISGPCLDRPPNQPHGMSQEEATALFHLRAVWQDRYLINFSGNVWRASRLGTFAKFNILAKTPEELRELVGEDYADWQREAREHNT